MQKTHVKMLWNTAKVIWRSKYANSNVLINLKKV